MKKVGGGDSDGGVCDNLVPDGHGGEARQAGGAGARRCGGGSLFSGEPPQGQVTGGLPASFDEIGIITGKRRCGRQSTDVRELWLGAGTIES